MAEFQTPTEASAISTVPVKDAQVQVTTETNGTLVDETPLFSQVLISAEVSAALPEGYSIRPLRKSDYHTGKAHSLYDHSTSDLIDFHRFSRYSPCPHDCWPTLIFYLCRTI